MFHSVWRSIVVRSCSRVCSPTPSVAASLGGSVASAIQQKETGPSHYLGPHQPGGFQTLNGHTSKSATIMKYANEHMNNTCNLFDVHKHTEQNTKVFLKCEKQKKTTTICSLIWAIQSPAQPSDMRHKIIRLLLLFYVISTLIFIANNIIHHTIFIIFVFHIFICPTAWNSWSS